MNNLPKISIITPSLNQGKFIERTIVSVLEQNYPNLEYIVVDGGSTDDTLDILRKYENRLRWISEKDQGQSDAINKGIKMSDGDILAYLNSDDEYEEGSLFRVADYFLTNPSSMWLVGRCRNIDETGCEIRRQITAYKNFFLKHYSYNALLVTNFICQPSTFLRRNVFGNIGLFSVSHHRVMDYDYWLRVGKVHTPGIINYDLSRFRVYQESKTSGDFVASFRQELAVCRKYSNSRIINMLHYLNFVGICVAYKALGLIARLGLKN